MIDEKRTGGPVFPTPVNVMQTGMTLRDYFAIHAPDPTNAEIAFEGEKDRTANPHGDTYKPKRRNQMEIIADLRFAFANAMIARREV